MLSRRRIVICFFVSVLFVLVLYGGFGLSVLKYETAVNDKNFSLFTIHGNSMEPTLKDGDEVYVDANYYKTHELQRGDIVAFKLKTQEKPFVKRVIALEGDRLEFGKDGNIYINGKILEEPYLLDRNFHFDSSKLKVLSIPLSQTNNTVPQGTVLVLGDSRRSSFDSEDYGFVPIEYVIGKVVN